MKINKIYYLVLILVSGLFGWRFYYLANGNVLVNYPYISNDGFDWYTEGIYLTKLIFQTSSIDFSLPVLRPPVFVIICAIDYASGFPGLFLALCLSLCIFLTSYFLIKIYILICENINFKINHFSILLILIGSLLSPLNFIRTFILSDGLAITLSIISIYYLFLYYKENRLYYILIASLVTIIAGLTQTYGMIPFLVALSTLSYQAKAYKFYFTSTLSILFFYISTILLWRLYMPHNSTPDNFNLLHFDTKMFVYYLKTWSFYFLPVISLFIIFGGKFILKNYNTKFLHPLYLVCLSVAVLVFFYQWPDPRFTYIFWPWVIIISSVFISNLSRKFNYCYLSFFLLLCFLTPNSYWGPSLISSKFIFYNTWFTEFFYGNYLSRDIDIKNIDELNSIYYLNGDPYLRSVLKVYSKLKFE